MPRPEMEPHLAADLEGSCPPNASPFMKEIFMSGDWLALQLNQLNCPKDQVEKICFAHGQQCFISDPWDSAKDQLAKYKSGSPDRPGLGLGEEIAAKFLGGKVKEQFEDKQKVRDLWYEKLSKFLE